MKTVLHTTGEIPTIEYDSDIPCLIGTINGFLPGDEIKKLMDSGLELWTEKRKIHGDIGWLSHLQSPAAFERIDLNWFVNDWSIRASNAGLQYLAVAGPNNEIVKMAFDFFDYNIRVNHVIINLFGNLEPALEWLRSSLNSGLINS